MKKILSLVAGLMLLSSVTFAADAEKKIELGIGGDLAVTSNAGYDLGFGGHATGLYRVNENFGVGLGVGYDTFGITGVSGVTSADLSFLALGKYAFGTEETKPYLIGGAGFSIFITSGPGGSLSSSYPELLGGGGVQFTLGSNANLYVQATANVILGSGSTFTYFPAEVGVNFDM
jgi:hypothetical protein